MNKVQSVNRLANGKTTTPKVSIFASIPAPKEQRVQLPVSFELDEAKKEIIIRVKIADEFKPSASGKSMVIANMPQAVDTGISIGNGRTISYGRGTFYVKA